MDNKRILVLGNKGMLGNAVAKFFSTCEGYTVVTTSSRYGDVSFFRELDSLSPDYIVNCIGKIPQKKPEEKEYFEINIDLPRELDKVGVPVIHPTTDCEFAGKSASDFFYLKSDVRDAKDTYGKSKVKTSEEILAHFKHTKMIRVSIIGHELKSSYSLLDWFLSSEGVVFGFTNKYWNGITTLQWAKECKVILENFDQSPKLTQLGISKCLSKFEVLQIVKDVYKKDIEVVPKESGDLENKCLLSDRAVPLLKDQLIELKNFYGK
jgi:dTDP-4-dehydrorhamnose reductase